jgi:two-component system, NarL family, response regulator LiaR
MTIRIVLVDDHSVVRKGLETFLSYDPELEVVGEAADGAEALRLTRELAPDVVVVDLLMPVVDGIAATAAIRRELPETEVLRLLAQGHSNKQIAHSLHNTEQTIKTHVSKILSKLGVQSRTQATLYAIRVGLVSARSPDAAQREDES